MPITCKLCNREFNSQITNKHLASAHNNMTTVEYKSMFGEDSLSSPEYRARLGASRKGENNSNYGNKWTDEQKAVISNINKGRTAHNKGVAMSEEQKEKLRLRALERKPTRTGAVLGEETKFKISQSIKKYAKENPEEMSTRGKKAYETRLERYGRGIQPEGYTASDETREKISRGNLRAGKIIRQNTNNLLIARMEKHHTVIDRDKDYKHFTLKCNHCGKQLTISRGMFYLSSYRDEECGYCRETNVSFAENSIKTT